VVRGEELAERPQPDHVPQRPADTAVPGRWVDAGDLRVGDVLLLRDGRQLPITALATRSTTEPVYNFCVQYLHCYNKVGLAMGRYDSRFTALDPCFKVSPHP
jgi:hypothetical protein